MTGRRIDESHRTSTPLELLFDLTFVVGVAQAALQLARCVETGRGGTGVVYFLMVFFAVWWAWMNFTWFASAFDTDDVPYRVLTMIQMAGVLIVAAGVPQAFGGKATAVSVGYVVMRIAMVTQWLRAARSAPSHRAAAHRYALLITVLQVLWILRLAIDGKALGLISFVVLALAEVSVPFIAERRNRTTWHPHHIAERYGLFTIIVLGECVASSMVAVQAGVERLGWSTDVILVFTSGLVILFALWWIYFLKPAGEALEARREWSYFWGYGHFFLHASLGALAAGQEVCAATLLHHLEISDTMAAMSVAVPVALFLVLVYVLHAPLGISGPVDGVMITGAAIASLVAGLLPGAGVALPWALLLISLPAVALIAYGTSRRPVPAP